MLKFEQLKPIHINRCLHILDAVFPKPWQELESSFQSSTKNLYGAFLEANLLGFIVISKVMDEAEILTFAVDPSYQGRGIGKRLLSYVICELKQAQITTLFLEVDITNIIAQNLYTTIGFKIIGKRKSYYPQANGCFNDGVIMCLKI